VSAFFELYYNDSKLIRFVIGHAIYCARLQSLVGRNYVLCYERYGSKVEDEFTSGIKSSRCGNDISMELSSVDRCRNTFAFELILLKVGVLYTPDCELTRVQIDCMLTPVVHVTFCSVISLLLFISFYFYLS